MMINMHFWLPIRTPGSSDQIGRAHTQ